MTAKPGDKSRQAILDIIRERRGIHKSELMRQCGKGWGNVGHHIQKLENLGHIEMEIHGRLLWIFDRQVERKDRDCIIATHQSPARRILEALGLRPHPATIRALSDELAVSKKVIRLHLTTLQRAQAVNKVEGYPPAFEAAISRKPAP